MCSVQEWVVNKDCNLWKKYFFLRANHFYPEFLIDLTLVKTLMYHKPYPNCIQTITIATRKIFPNFNTKARVYHYFSILCVIFEIQLAFVSNNCKIGVRNIFISICQACTSIIWAQNYEVSLEAFFIIT